MTAQIRILQVVGGLGIGGIQSFLIELYRHMNRTQIQFDFVVHIKTKENYIREIETLGGKVFFIDNDAFEKRNMFEYIRFWKQFFQKHPEYKIVHGHLRSTSALYLYEAKKAGCYTIVHSHSTSNGVGINALIKNILQYPTRYIADFCMGCSLQANKWMFGERRMHSDTCTVIYDGIDIKKFKFNESIRIKKRMELGFKNDDYIIGCIANLVESKNQKTIIDAMPIILKEIPSAILILIGDGPMAIKLHNRIKALQLGKKQIQMLGTRTDVNELLNAIDLFVMPSRYEGFCIASIEAQTNGVQVIVSDAIPKEAFITERIKQVKYNTTKTWAKEIIKCKYLKNNRNINVVVPKKYDIHDVAKKLTTLYLSLSSSFYLPLTDGHCNKTQNAFSERTVEINDFES